MPELTTEEVTVQGLAMTNYLHQQVVGLIARLAESEGHRAILELRCQNLQRLNEALKPPDKPDGG